jgi:hypothetical protein
MLTLPLILSLFPLIRGEPLVYTVKTSNRSKRHLPVIYIQQLHLLQERKLVSLFKYLGFS